MRGRGEVRTVVWWGNPGERNIIVKWIFRKLGRRAWNGSMWLRIGTGGGGV